MTLNINNSAAVINCDHVSYHHDDYIDQNSYIEIAMLSMDNVEENLALVNNIILDTITEIVISDENNIIYNLNNLNWHILNFNEELENDVREVYIKFGNAAVQSV